MTTFSVNLSFMNCWEKLARMDFKLGTELGREWAGEASLNLLKGRVGTDVNMQAYGYVCDKNVAMTKSKREVALLDTEELEKNCKGVANTVASSADKNLDRVIELADVKDFVDEFLFMRREILIEEGLDIWKLFKMGVCNCNKRAKATLQALIKSQNIGEMLYELMEQENLKEALGGILK